MQQATKLANTLDSSTYLQFYNIMKYPIPKQKELFFEGKKVENIKINKEFSRDKKNPYMDEYLQKIEEIHNLLLSLPFVESIYLCNSISFNALQKNSDIDLFIITSPKRIRTAKFRSMILFSLYGVKRFGTKQRKKCCLSFFITKGNENLYEISLPNRDIYLSYRIEHLVLLYQANPNQKEQIFEKNQRIKGILPNFPKKQSIFLGNPVYTGKNTFKKIIEKIGSGIIGDLSEEILKILQKFMIVLKKIRDPIKNKDVITNDHMLKFHQDIREKISLKYNIKNR